MENETSKQVETKALSIVDVMAMLPSDGKMEELIRSRSQLYTSYSVKDKEGKYRGVVDIESVVELLREVFGNLNWKDSRNKRKDMNTTMKHTDMNKYKIIKRIVVIPFVFGMVLTAHVFYAMKKTFLFTKYGGEFIAYDKEENITIQDVYNEIKSQRKP